MSGLGTPIYQAKQKYFFLTLWILVLLYAISKSVLGALNYSPALWVPSVIFIALLFLIRHKRILVYDKCFVIVKTRLITTFSQRQKFEYKDIKQLTFEKGYVNWFFIVTCVFNGTHLDFGSPSLFHFSTVDNDFQVVKIIGSQKDFLQAYTLIKKKV